VIVNAAIEHARRAPPRRRDRDDAGAQLRAAGRAHSPGTHDGSSTARSSNSRRWDDADPIQAAAFGLTDLTAYSMMRTKADLLPGQSVLITGIGGGVALAALSIATHLGCRVCVTSRHTWKLDRAMELGADHAVLDEGADWSRAVRKWSRKRGVDLAVDSAGKATHLWCIKSLARGGAYVTPGCTSGPDATTDLARIFWNQLRILGSTMGSVDDFAEIASLYRTGAYTPVIDSVHDAADGRKAYERLESGEQFGKVVIDWR
jgi:NADPH:quinone reductase-like Zn-dependent oxidoreductase